MNYKIKGLEVERTDEQLDELIKERENKGKPWKPKYGGLYWFVDSYGGEGHTVWGATTFDLRKYNTNNCFKTKEGAKERAKYDNAVIAVNTKIRELNDGWISDWSDYDQRKWLIYYDYRMLSWRKNYAYHINEFSILSLIKSGELAEQVIEDCAEELETIKKYKFNK